MADEALVEVGLGWVGWVLEYLFASLSLRAIT